MDAWKRLMDDMGKSLVLAVPVVRMGLILLVLVVPVVLLILLILLILLVRVVLVVRLRRRRLRRRRTFIAIMKNRIPAAALRRLPLQSLLKL